jgi:hypothetical protein
VDLGYELDGDALAFVPPAGAPDLREAIAARYEGLTAEDIVISAGASEALAAIALALLEPGSRAAVDGGIYPSFTEAAKSAGATLAPESLAPGRGSSPPTPPPGGPQIWPPLRATGATFVADEVYRDLRVPCPPPPPSIGAISIGDLRSRRPGALIGGLRPGRGRAKRPTASCSCSPGGRRRSQCGPRWPRSNASMPPSPPPWTGPKRTAPTSSAR